MYPPILFVVYKLLLVVPSWDSWHIMTLIGMDTYIDSQEYEYRLPQRMMYGYLYLELDFLSFNLIAGMLCLRTKAMVG